MHSPPLTGRSTPRLRDKPLGVLTGNLSPHVLRKVQAGQELQQFAAVVVAAEEEPVGVADEQVARDGGIGLQGPQRTASGKSAYKLGYLSNIPKRRPPGPRAVSNKLQAKCPFHPTAPAKSPSVPDEVRIRARPGPLRLSIVPPFHRPDGFPPLGAGGHVQWMTTGTPRCPARRNSRCSGDRRSANKFPLTAHLHAVDINGRLQFVRSPGIEDGDSSRV